MYVPLDSVAVSGLPLLEMTGISKRFGRIQVLSQINLTLDRGECVALIGENGAGKSTLSKILTGVIQQDEGRILLAGEQVKFATPRDALAHGIALIPQELAYVPNLTIAENILLGHWPNWIGISTRKAVVKRAIAECQRVGIDLGDLNRRMLSLRLAELQLVEIVKVLSWRARLIVLDEPTASLSEHDSRALFAVLDRLTEEGVGIIYVSHRMDEVHKFSHRVIVLRNGEMVASVAPSNATPSELIAYMLGEAKKETPAIEPPVNDGSKPAAELHDWRGQGLLTLNGVSLLVHGSEVVGVYGLRGCGADLVAEGLAGLRPEISGTMVVAGRKTPLLRSPRAAKKAGISFVPADRKRDGLILLLSVQSNLVVQILRSVSMLGLIRRRLERAIGKKLAKKFDIRFHSLDQPVGQLSGGNQQKVLLASRLAKRPSLLVLQEPTRGVDVGARVEIHKILLKNAEQGCPTLLVTSDVEEAVIACHRLYVMRDGAIVGELAGENKTMAAAITLAAGGHLDQ
jgi:ribose transport system ATP-binding protein